MNTSIGILLCTCGSSLDKIDFAVLSQEAQNLEKVSWVQTLPLACKQDKDFWLSLKGKFNRFLFVGCSERSSLTFSEDKIAQILKILEIDPGFFETVNIREHCVWVHPQASQQELTSKCLDMLLMAHAKLLNNVPAIETKNLKQEVMVLGGGVAGLSTALTLAQMGVKTTIVEKKAFLGGLSTQIPFLWQSEGSTSFCTSECVLPVLARDTLYKDQVEVLTQTEVAKVQKQGANFEVSLVQAPEYVNPNLCISCGKCAQVCPEEEPNSFDFGLTKKKAIAKDHFLLFPDRYVIDQNACTMCGKCEPTCPTKAIDLKAKAKTISKTVGSIVLATGFQPADPKQYQHLNLNNPKVITLTQFERLVANRFFGKPPISIVFVLCQKDKVGFCSKLCCTITLKHVFRLSSFFMGTEVRVIYKNLRPTGRNGEFYLKASKERGAEFIQADLKEITGEDWLEVKTSAGDFEADLVVLAEPLLPQSVVLSKELGLEVDEFNYPVEFQPRVVRPGESLVERVFLAGSAKGPKDVQDSIDSGAKAGLNAYASLKGRSQKYVSYIDSQKCSHCGMCVPMCPHKAIIQQDKEPFFSIAADFCKGCGLCVVTCPSKAITLRNLDDHQLLTMVDKAFLHAQPDQPRILAFLCYWCAYGASDLMGPKGFEIPLNVRTIRIRCSASFNPDLAIEILTQNKADGIIVGGCPPKNCHHQWGNYLELRRIKIVKEMLNVFNLPKDSLRFEYIGVTLYDKLAKILKAMSNNLKNKE